MTKPFWISSSIFGAVLLFGSGVLVGRQFPAHHFERVPNTPYLFDSSTGHMCHTFTHEDGTPYTSMEKYLATLPEPENDAKAQKTTIPFCK